MKSVHDPLAGSMRLFIVTAMLGTLSLMAACGGSGGSNNNSSGSSITSTTSAPSNITPAASAANVVSMTVDSTLDVNVPYVTVKVCKPGTTTCSTIPYVLVDTGSYGLRVMNTPANATAISSLGLPQITSGGGKLAECITFLDNSFIWGLVQKADVYVSGETTTTHGSGGIPIHVIGDPSDGHAGDSTFPAVPSACGTASNAGNTFSAFGANGVLGIGPFIQDCGDYCQTAVTSPAMYYSCSGSNCGTGVTVLLANQVSNPVAYFADNNGTIIELPNLPSSGATSVTNGVLVFGIGTQSNNTLGSANVLTTDGYGNFTTQFKGHSYSQSFIDSGSNGLYFLDSSTLSSLVGSNSFPTCTDTADFGSAITSFYCPGSTQSLSATNVGANGNTVNTSFSIANTQSLFTLNGGNNLAFNNLGGTNPGSFDWGLSFFYGRNVYTAIYGVTPPSGVQAGPWWAY